MVDNCDLDRMSIFELNDIMKVSLGYEVAPIYFFKPVGIKEFRQILDDATMLKYMYEGFTNGRLVTVCCEHPLQVIYPNNNGEKGVSEKHDGKATNEVEEEEVNEEEEEREVNEEVEEEEVNEEVGRSKKTVYLSDDDVVGVEEETDYENEDELRYIYTSSHTSSDDEQDNNEDQDESDKEVEKMLPRMPEFVPEVDMKNPVFKKGMVFPDANTFRAAIREYAIKDGRDIRLKKNDPNRVRAVCEGGNCKWVCFASPFRNTGTWVIKTYNDAHECGRSQTNRFMNSKWLAKNYMSEFKDNENWDVNNFISKVKDNHGVENCCMHLV